MPHYQNWTVEIRNLSEFHLIIDGKSGELFVSREIAESSTSILPKTGQITAISRDIDSDNVVKIHLGGIGLKLNVEKFKETTLFYCKIRNVDSLLNFWNTHSDFLRCEQNEESKSRESSIGLFLTNSSTDLDYSTESNELSVSNEVESDSSSRNLEDTWKQKNPTKENGENKITKDIYDSTSDNKLKNKDKMERTNLIRNVSEKKVGFKMFDIFDLEDPPSKYMVREKDDEFIQTLSNTMIEKNAVSVDNAPTVVGLIDLNKSEFREDKLSTYKVFVIDGTHSIHAQKIAYQKTKDPMFRYRPVNLYCGLTEVEALFLGISRNEDTSLFVKFSDCQKVDLVRRRLYSMTNTSMDQEPPPVPKSFKDVFVCLLNLKGKSELDGKNIIRFLSTSLSNRCYTVYKKICSRNVKIPASKFECLRGLCEEDAYTFLKELMDSNLERESWQSFVANCRAKQKIKKARKEVTATIKFHKDGMTRLSVGNKVINCNFVCFKFCDHNDRVTFLSSRELKYSVFERENLCSITRIPDISVSQKQLTSSDSSSDKKHTYTYSRKDAVSASVTSKTPVTPTIDKQKSYLCARYNQLPPSKITKNPVTSTADKKHAYTYSRTDTVSASETKTSLTSAIDKKKSYLCDRYNELPPLRTTKPPFTSTPDEKPAYTCSRKDAVPASVTSKTTVTSAMDKNKNYLCKRYNQLPSSGITQNPITSTSGMAGPSIAFDASDDFLSSDVREFVSLVADGYSCEDFEQTGCLIEEENVETVPENLVNDIDILLDSTVRNKAKVCFTEDAWASVCQTLHMLEDIVIEREVDDKKGSKVSRDIYSFNSDTDISPVKCFTDEHIDKSVSVELDKLPVTEISDEQSQNPASVEVDTVPVTDISGGNKRSLKHIGLNEIAVTKAKRCKVRVTDIALVNDPTTYKSQCLKNKSKKKK